MYVGACGSQMRASDPLAVKLKVSVWGLETELGSSARAIIMRPESDTNYRQKNQDELYDPIVGFVAWLALKPEPRQSSMCWSGNKGTPGAENPPSVSAG